MGQHGDRYEGDFVEGNKRHGRGIYVWANGDRYEGEWRDGKRTGWGTHTSANGKVKEGEWKNDKLVRLSARLKRQRRLERERREAEWEEWEREQAELERELAEQERQNNARFNESLNRLGNTIMQYHLMKDRFRTPTRPSAPRGGSGPECLPRELACWPKRLRLYESAALPVLILPGQLSSGWHA